MPDALKNQNSPSEPPRGTRKKPWPALPLLLLVLAAAVAFYVWRSFGRKFVAEAAREGGSSATGELATLSSTNGTTGGTNQPDPNAGVTYLPHVVEEVPWSIHIVKVDRSRSDLRFETTLGLGKHIGMSLVSEQVKAMPTEIGLPLVAVNGDFYKTSSKYPGDPEGIQIIRGEIVSAPRSTHSCFWVDASGKPHVSTVQSHFKVKLPDGRTAALGLNEKREDDAVVLYTAATGASTRTSSGIELVLSHGTNAQWLPLRVGETYTARVKQVRTNDAPLSRETMVLSVGPKISSQVAGVKIGDTLTISMATTPDLKGSPAAIGGGPALVHNRAVENFSGLQPRHPRTALGWNKNHFFLVAVDGRQRTSAGMTFAELATYMLNLGCDEALNLDGGGSSTLWAKGNVRNNPSEGRERPAANALVLVRKQ